MSFTTVKLPKALVDLVKELINEYPELDYTTVQDFVKDAVRCRIIDIRKGFRREDILKQIPKESLSAIKTIVEELEDLTKWGAPEEDILEMAEKAGIDKEKARDTLEKLKEKGELYSPKYGYYKVAGYY